MLVRRNILANFSGQALTALLSLALVPVYIRYLTIEAYALVGLFAVLQVWLSLLDLGTTPTIAREMARFTAGASAVQQVRDLLRSTELLCGGIGLTIAGGLMLGADTLAQHWLQLERLSAATVADAFSLIGIVIGLRFVEGLYRSGLMGLQHQLWLNVATVGLAVLRSVGAVIVLAEISATIQAFFLWQATVSLLALALLGIKLHLTLPPAPRAARFSRAALYDMRYFAGGMAGTSILAVLLTQIDKLLLSRLLPLSEFGYYMLASSVAAGLYLMVTPIVQAVYPAFVRLAESGDEGALAATYHKSSQLVTVLLGPAMLLLALFPREILLAWSGDALLATRTAPLLALLAAGTFLNALMQLPVQLQMAHGWTRWPLVANIVAVAILVPALLLLVPRYGGLGAASIWLVLNLGYALTLAMPLHRRVMRGQMMRWYAADIGLPLAAATATLLPVYLLIDNAEAGRLGLAIGLCAAGALAGLAGALAADTVRARMFRIVRPWLSRPRGKAPPPPPSVAPR